MSIASWSFATAVTLKRQLATSVRRPMGGSNRTLRSGFSGGATVPPPVCNGSTDSGASGSRARSISFEASGLVPSAATGALRRTRCASLQLFGFLEKSRAKLEARAPLDESTVSSLKELVSELQAEDFSVKPTDLRRIQASSGIAYMEVHSEPMANLCIFFLRRGARIPLHDHPGMYVFGRLLFGRLRVASYDEHLDPASGRRVSAEGRPGCFWGSLNSVEEIGPDPTTYWLSPQERNLHEISALEDTAFFDVLTPPYDGSEGRDCAFYEAEADPKNDDGKCLLVPTYEGVNCMDHFRYRGPTFEEAVRHIK